MTIKINALELKLKTDEVRSADFEDRISKLINLVYRDMREDANRGYYSSVFLPNSESDHFMFTFKEDMANRLKEELESNGYKVSYIKERGEFCVSWKDALMTDTNINIE